MKSKNASRFLVLVFGMLTAHAWSQQPAPAPSEADALQEKYKTEVDEKVRKPFLIAVDQLSKKQIAELERAKESAQRSNKLDYALALTSDIESINAGAPLPEQDDPAQPAALRNLRSSYRRSLAKLIADQRRQVRPYNEQYARTLDKLVAKLTTEGKLEEAKTARARRERIRPDEMPPPPGVKSLHEFLVGSKWLWNGNKNWEMVFLADGTVDQADWIRKGLVTGWKTDGETQVTLTILKGRTKDKTATLIFAEDRMSFTGVDFGEKNPIAQSERVLGPETDS